MEKRKKSYYNCCVYGCRNSTINSELSFFKLPPAPERRKTWLRLIDRVDLIGSPCSRARVCEAHFTSEYINVSKQRKHLSKNTVPILNLPLTPLPDYLTHKSVQTNIPTADKSLQCNFLTKAQGKKGKRKFFNQIEVSKKRKVSSDAQSEMNMFHELCDKYLSTNLAEIVKQKVENQIHQVGSRFSLKYKIFCLNLYYTSPQAYNLLKETLCLPSKRTLSKMNTHISTRIDNHLMYILKTKLKYVSDADRNCALVVGAMSLKVNLFYNITEDKIYGFHEVDGVQSPEIANYAIVAMIHGLFDNYKQPVGFALIAECKQYQSVSEWIDKIIKKLLSIGIRVRVLVSDMATNFLDSARNRSISVEHPYFFVDRRKIYYIIDPHNLVKVARNNLMKYDFHFKKNVAKWDHIVRFYEMDKSKRLRLAPKLTESHIKPTKLEKMNINYAVDVLSPTVAAGLSMYRDFRKIEKSAEGTIKLIELMNDLINFLNTTSLYGRTQYHNALCGQEYQISFLNKMLEFFKSLKLINPKNDENVTTTAKFIDGFQITLKSLFSFFEDLKIEGYSYILTRKLNQECLENIFSEIRTRNKNSREPTTWHLVSALRKIFLTNVSYSLKSDNCKENLTKCLLDGEKLHHTPIKEDVETMSTGSTRHKDEHYVANCSLEGEDSDNTSIKEECDLEISSTTSNKDENEDNAAQSSFEGENVYNASIRRDHNQETWISVSNKEDDSNAYSIPQISTTDYSTLDLPQNNELLFISGYLLQKCLEQHEECDEFTAYIKRDSLEDLSHDPRFTQYNDYIKDGNKQLSTIPPDNFVEFVRLMEERFCKFFEDNYQNCLILKSILNNIQNATFKVPCKCFPIAYCKKLFIRMRIYHLLKYNNREYKPSKDCRKLFSVTNV